eukprot:GFUD01007739.1.p1 GENE.GFUD01007739.1~~GFUD01007739.1.p1  ORF type:complete len:206 (-),score=64.68 GFUD01007739.1:26-619(-)
MVTWDKPSKNPGAVEIYRVFWRPVGAKGSNKTDIVENKIVLHELASETLYEVVIKAGNADGTSQLAEPVHFQITDSLSVEQAPLMSNVGEGFGIFLVVLIIIGAIISVIYILHKKNLILFIVKKPDRPTVAFENPFYAIRNPPIYKQEGPLQDPAGENYNVHISSSSAWSSELSGTSSESATSSESGGDRWASLGQE